MQATLRWGYAVDPQAQELLSALGIGIGTGGGLAWVGKGVFDLWKTREANRPALERVHADREAAEDATVVKILETFNLRAEGFQADIQHLRNEIATVRGELRDERAAHVLEQARSRELAADNERLAGLAERQGIRLEEQGKRIQGLMEENAVIREENAKIRGELEAVMVAVQQEWVRSAKQPALAFATEAPAQEDLGDAL